MVKGIILKLELIMWRQRFV